MSTIVGASVKPYSTFVGASVKPYSTIVGASVKPANNVSAPEHPTKNSLHPGTQ